MANIDNQTGNASNRYGAKNASMNCGCIKLCVCVLVRDWECTMNAVITEILSHPITEQDRSA